MLPSKPSSLSALASLIVNGISAIEAGCADRNVQYPTLDDPPTPESLAIQQEFSEQSIIIVAAAYQLMATLMPPQSFYRKMLYGVSKVELLTDHVVLIFVIQVQQTVAVGVAEAGHVAEVLRDAGPEVRALVTQALSAHLKLDVMQGINVSDIGKRTTLDPKKLGSDKSSSDIFKISRLYSPYPSSPHHPARVQGGVAGLLHQQPHFSNAGHRQAIEGHLSGVCAFFFQFLSSSHATISQPGRKIRWCIWFCSAHRRAVSSLRSHLCHVITLMNLVALLALAISRKLPGMQLRLLQTPKPVTLRSHRIVRCSEPLAKI